MHLGFFKGKVESPKEKVWYTIFLSYVAIIGALFVVFKVHATASVTVCSSGCDYTTIAAAEGDASFVGVGGTIRVQGTYDPTAEAGTTITATQPDVVIDCESSGAYLGTTAASTTIYLNTTGAGGVQNCNARRLQIYRNTAAGSNAGFTVSNITFDPASQSAINLDSFTSPLVTGSTGYFQIYASTSTNATISNNTFSAPAGSFKTFINFEGTGPLGTFTIDNNTFNLTDYRSTDGNGATGYNSATFVFTNNKTFYTGTVLDQVNNPIFGNATITFKGNVFSAPFALTNGFIVFRSEQGAPMDIENNTFMTSSTGNETAITVATPEIMGAAGAASYTISKNLFYNYASVKGQPLIPTAQMASSSLTGTAGLTFQLNQPQTLTITQGYNGFYGFNIPYRDLVGGFTPNGTDKTSNPFMRLEDISTSDDWEPAPWSDYLDVNGTDDIGAFSGVRRANIHISWAGHGDPIDYNTVDAFDLFYIATSTAGLRNGDSIDLTSGMYTFGGMTSSTQLSSMFGIFGPYTGSASISAVTGSPNEAGPMRFDGIDHLSLQNLFFTLSGGTNALYIGHAVNVNLINVSASINTGDTIFPHNVITLDSVNNSYISGVTTNYSNAAPTSTATSAYLINKTVFSKAGTDYNDSGAIGSPPNSALYFRNTGCDVQPISSSATDITSTVGSGTNDWNLALLSVSGFHLSVWAPNNLYPSAAAIVADPDCAGHGIAVDAFVPSAFTASAGTLTYNPSAVSGAGLTIVGGFDNPPAISHTTGLTINGAGLYFLNSSNNDIRDTTSTNAGCSVALDGASANNTLTRFDAVATSTGVQFCSNATGLLNNFVASNIMPTSTLFGPMASAVTSSVRVGVYVGERNGGAPVSGVPVTVSSYSGGSDTVTSDVTGFTPLTNYFNYNLISPPAFNFSTAATGIYLASSTIVSQVFDKEIIYFGLATTSAENGGSPSISSYLGPDAVTPAIQSFTINDGATVTTSTTVTLKLVATNAEQMGFSLSSDFSNAVVSSYQQAISYLLSGSLGVKRIYAIVKSPTNTFSAPTYQEITLISSSTPIEMVDAPTISMPTYVSTTTVSLAITYGANAAQMMISNSADFTGGVWEPATSTKKWFLQSGDGEKTVYIKVRSAMATESAITVGKTTLNTVVPSAPVIKAPTNNSHVTGGTVVFTGTADVKTNLLLLIETNSKEIVHVAVPVATDGTWSYAVPDALPVGVYKATAIASDIVGNTQQDINIFSVLAATPGVALVVNSPSDGATVTKTSVAASGTGQIGAKIIIVQNGITTYTTTVGSDANWNINLSLPAQDGVYSLEFRMLNQANDFLDGTQRSITLTQAVVIPPPVKKDILPPVVTNPTTPTVGIGGGTITTGGTSSTSSTTDVVSSTPIIIATPSSTQTTISNAISAVADTFSSPVSAATVTAVKAVSAQVSRSVTKAAVAVQQAVATPQVQITNQAVVVPAAAAVVAASVSTALNFSQVALYFRFLFTQPLFLLTRKRRKGWGMAYNAISKLPADLALVRIVDAESGRVVQSHVTDRDGRYQFFARPGNYRIEVDKPNFSFPAAYMTGKTEDGQLTDLYNGGVVPLTAASQISYNLPLDPGGSAKPAAEIVHAKNKERLINALGAGGVVLTLVSFAVSPTIFVGAFVVAQVASYFVFRRLAVPKKPKTWGVVKDSATGKPLDQAVVRVFDTQYNKLLETQITDDQGRYSFLVGKNQYYIMVEKPGFQSLTTEPITVDAPQGGAALAKDVAIGRTMVDKPAFV